MPSDFKGCPVPVAASSGKFPDSGVSRNSGRNLHHSRMSLRIFLGAGPKIVTVAHPSAGPFSEFICRLQIFLYFPSSRLQTGATS
jgi:hypothetical protein